MSKTDNAESVLIIGAGIIGISCAHYLIESGYQVTVIDKGSIAGACSHGNCGHILPSDILPLNSIGAIKTAFLSLFNSSSPLRVKPRVDADFMKWMWQFTVRCNNRHQLYAAKHLQSILKSSFHEYTELLGTLLLDCGWNKNGLLYPFLSESALTEFSKKDQWLSKNFDVSATLIKGEELNAVEPALTSGLAGAFYYEEDASLRPDLLARQWSGKLKEKGVEFLENCEFEGLDRQSERITTIQTTKGSFKIDHVVLAAGAISKQFSQQFECQIPLEPGKGYSMIVEKPKHPLKASLVLMEKNVSVTPFQDSLRLGSMMEFVGFDLSISEQRIMQLRDLVNPYFDDVLGESYTEVWCGWRPMTWDSLPIIGRIPKLENAYLATGHNMIGVMSAPATGKLIAEMISETIPHIDDTPFSPKRFH